MNSYVDYMIANDIVLPNIPVQGETETGNWTISVPGVSGFAKNVVC